MSSALIIGGRGQSGMAIAARLLEDGWRVTATTSAAPPEPDGALGSGVEWVEFTRDESSDLAALVGPGVDVVVDITAFTLGHARQLVALGDRIGSAVVISTMGVYADAAGRSMDGDPFPEFQVPIPEASPTVEPGDDGYASRKVAVELFLREKAPWAVTIIRPGAIHGPYSHHLREWYFVKRVLDRRTRVLLPFNGESVFQPTATANLAELVALAARKPGERTLNCGDSDPPTAAEIGALVDDAMGWSTERVLIAGPPPATNVGDHPWAVPRPVVADMRAARDELGYRPATSYAGALPRTVAWAVEAASGRDWREVFTTLAAYPTDMFDYEAEDGYLDSITAD